MPNRLLEPDFTTNADADLPRERRLFSYLTVLARRKKMILKVCLSSTVISAIIILLWPNWYASTTRLVIPQQSQSSSAMLLNQLNSLASIPGISSGALGGRTPGDLYVGMLKSRTVADAVINQYHLRDVYSVSYQEDARKKLDERSEILLGKDGIIAITVEDRDRNRAAALANAYAASVNDLTKRVAITEASQRRAFFESELKGAKDNLASAEVELKKVQIQTGLIHLEGQAKAIIDNIARLRSQLILSEVRLETLRSYETDSNPDVIKEKSTVAELRAQLDRMERYSSNKGGGVMLPTGEVPEAGLEYVRKLRNVKYYETVYEVLAKQFESAKIDESKDLPALQVLELAVPSEKKAGPKRVITILMVLVISFFLACLLAFVIEEIHELRADSRERTSIESFLNALRWS